MRAVATTLAAFLTCASCGALASAKSPPKDGVLASLQADLPEGWSVRVGRGQLSIQFDRPVQIVWANCINAPQPCPAPSAPSRPGRVRIVYRTEGRWASQRLRAAQQKNAALDATLGGLVAKYGLGALFARRGHGKQPPEPAPANDDEAKRLGAYQKERAKLEATRVKTPSCQTDTLSLFDRKEEGLDGDFEHIVSPAHVTEQAFKLLERLRALCGG